MAGLTTDRSFPYYRGRMEKPVLFECKGQQIVGMLHLPDGRNKVPGVLLLHGFTGHKAEIHRMFVKLSRRLMAQGIGSLRFDFRGCGDSGGEFEEMTLRTKICDAVTALKFLCRQKRVDAKRIALVGLSLGGAIAAHVVGREKTPIRSLVLISPVAEGAGILDELATPEAVASLAQTGITDYFGNLVGVQFIRQFADMKPLREVVKCQCPVLLIHGEKDETVPAGHSDLYEEALRNAGRTVKKVIVPDADHTFNRHRWEERVLSETVNWLVATL
ncbi:MAG: alpha/beta fold hydrolase [Verrucomicrobiae bacterium]|nr:alpha/beta fold hydrolase [Verrucomicrobiae bacterium]